MGVKVAKFGGTSVADAAQLRKVQAIIGQDPERRVVVVSAPGKRTPQDVKITDLLYRCHDCVSRDVAFDEIFEALAERFCGIVRDLGLSIAIEKELSAIREGIARSRTPDYAASRGEYLTARIVADLLNSEFVDAAEIIRFDADGPLLHQQTVTAISERLQSGKHVVVPGF